jgi:hypothetical protein
MRVTSIVAWVSVVTLLYLALASGIDWMPGHDRVFFLLLIPVGYVALLSTNHLAMYIATLVVVIVSSVVFRALTRSRDRLPRMVHALQIAETYDVFHATMVGSVVAVVMASGRALARSEGFAHFEIGNVAAEIEKILSSAAAGAQIFVSNAHVVLFMILLCAVYAVFIYFLEYNISEYPVSISVETATHASIFPKFNFKFNGMDKNARPPISQSILVGKLFLFGLGTAAAAAGILQAGALPS